MYEALSADSTGVAGAATMVHAVMTRDVFLETHGRVIIEGGVMVLTRSQKEAEDALFGPFSRMKLAGCSYECLRP